MVKGDQPQEKRGSFSGLLAMNEEKRRRKRERRRTKEGSLFQYQLRDPVLDVETVFVRLLPEGHRGVATEVLVEEAGAGQPLPVADVERPVVVQQVQVEHPGTFFPVLP